MNWSPSNWSILLERPSGPVALSDCSLRILEYSSSRANGALRSASGDWVSAACGSLAAASTASAAPWRLPVGCEDDVLLRTDTGARPVHLRPGIFLSLSLSTEMGLSMPAYSFSSERVVRDTHLLPWTSYSVSISPTLFAFDPCQFARTRLS